MHGWDELLYKHQHSALLDSGTDAKTKARLLIHVFALVNVYGTHGLCYKQSGGCIPSLTPLS